MKTDFDRIVGAGIHRGKSSRELFMAKVLVEPSTGCWIWQGRINPNGYGQLTRKRTSLYAHRYAYESMVGEIPIGTELDHLCRVRSCCNPAHLEPVTRQVNSLRGIGPGLTTLRKFTVQHCKKGHEFTADNTRWTKTGWRRCRQCESDYKKIWKARHAI